jgi:hypothetical protein
MRERYWRMLHQYKSDLLYYDYYFQHTVRVGRVLKVLTTIVSSTSIAIWALSKWNAMIFSAIIVAAQVVATVYDYLPYQRRADELFEMKTRLQKIYNKMEHEWFFIDRQVYDDSKTNEIRTALTEEWLGIEAMFFQKDALPRNKKMLICADQEKCRYFENTL